MPRSGGVYTLPPGINPVVNGTFITSNWANTTLQDIATALTNSLAKDGQTVPTANLPMGGFRHTGVGNPTLRDQYASLGFVQDSSHLRLANVTVIGNAITATLVGSDNTYTNGQMFQLILPSSPTANPTLSVNGGPVLSLRNSTGIVIPSSVLIPDIPYLVIYNGTNFVLINGSGEYLLLSGGTLSGDLTIDKAAVNATLFLANGGTPNGGVTNYGAPGVGDVGIFSNVAAGLVRVRPNGRNSATGQTTFDTTTATFTTDVFVNKSVANVAVGTGNVQNGGLANYGGTGIGDIGLYSEPAAGTIRVRPNGRASVTAETRFDTNSTRFLAPAVEIGTPSGGAVGNLRVEDATSGARISMAYTSNRRYSIGNNGLNWTLRDENATLDRFILLSTGQAQFQIGSTANTPTANLAAYQASSSRADIHIENESSDTDGVQVGGIWGQNRSILPGAEKRIAGMVFVTDGVTATARGGSIAFFCKLDNAVTMAQRWRLRSAGHWEPNVTDVFDIGTSALRVRQYYGTQSTINTSDARLKTEVMPLTANERAAARELAQEIGTYQWLKSVAEKGAGARLHVGLTVQRAIEIMKSYGLDPMRYGFICYDEWPERIEPAITDRQLVKEPVYEEREVIPAEHETYEIAAGVYHEDILREAVTEEFPVPELRDDDDNVIREAGFVTREISPALVERVEIVPPKMGIRTVREAVRGMVEVEPAVYEDVVIVPEVVHPAGDVFSFRYDNLALFMIAGMAQAD